jgi:hypothetical protein
MRPVVALVAVFLASVVVGGLLHLFQPGSPTSPSVPQPSAPASSPPDLRWYKSLPTASPGCPKSVAPGLKPFYPNCFGRPQ